MNLTSYGYFDLSLVCNVAVGPGNVAVGPGNLAINMTVNRPLVSWIYPFVYLLT